MNTKTVSMIALLASLGLAQPVLAQSDQQQPAGAEQTQKAPDQAETAPQKAPDQADTSTAQPPAPPEEQATAPDTKSDEEQATAPDTKSDMGKMAAAGGGQIVLQDNDTFLASDFIGTTVYSAQDEKLGDVNDLIFAKDGTVDGVVIGVGGFLGLGEKDVAFTMDRLQMTETEDGIKLTVDTTSEELADAEPFKSKQAQKVEADAEQARMEQESRASNSGGAANPANPPSSEPAQAPTQTQ